MHIQWNLTESCNLRCSHCYQEGAAPGDGPSLSADQIRTVLDRLLGLFGAWGIPGHLSLSGGEPLVSPRFWEVAEVLGARTGGPGFSVLTNGTLVTGPVARRLKALGCRFVQVSLDGSRDVHDRIRGRGSFDQAAAGLRALRRAGVATLVSFTAGVANAGEFPRVVRASRRLGVDVVWSDRLLPLGRGQDQEILAPLAVERYFRSMAAARPRLWEGWFSRTTIRMHRALQFHTLEELGVPAQPYSCTAGKTLLSILADGTVVPCRRLPVPVGNALTDDLDALYRNAPFLRRLRDEGVPGECAGCPAADRCRGGLRCLSQAYFGDPFRADPQCFKIYQTLPPRSAP